MRKYNRIKQRVLNEAKYIVKNKATIREAADHFKVSKSNLHSDITDRLESIDIILYFAVKDILHHNKMMGHLRGGEATRKKYSITKA
ncbi:MAG: sporulation transcriptional regulator SpoIIID [Clostridia bacterium]|nr:sporulation transcriptional regulator SpoIIID [Clostridia bacterium]